MQATAVADVKRQLRRASDLLFSVGDLPHMLVALVTWAEVALVSAAAGPAPAAARLADATVLSQAYWREAWSLLSQLYLRGSDVASRTRAPLAFLTRLADWARRLVRLLLLYGGTFAADGVLAFDVYHACERAKVQALARHSPWTVARPRLNMNQGDELATAAGPPGPAPPSPGLGPDSSGGGAGGPPRHGTPWDDLVYASRAVALLRDNHGDRRWSLLRTVRAHLARYTQGEAIESEVLSLNLATMGRLQQMSRPNSWRHSRGANVRAPNRRAGRRGAAGDSGPVSGATDGEPDRDRERGGPAADDSSSSGPTVVDPENPLPLATLTFAQLGRRLGGQLDGLLIATALEGGVAVFVPESGAVGFALCVKEWGPRSGMGRGAPGS